MTVEYRIVVETKFGSTHRWPMKSLEKAEATKEVYESTTSPYFSGCRVWIEQREIPKWVVVEEREMAK